MRKIYTVILYIIMTALIVVPPMARGMVRAYSLIPVLPILGLWLFWIAQNSRPQKGFVLMDIFIAGFAVIACLSFFAADYKHDYFQAVLSMASYAMLYYVILNGYTSMLRRYVSMLLVVLGSSLSLYGLLQYAGVLPHAWWVPENFLSSTYVNHNHFSGFLELIIPVALCELISTGRGKKLKSFLLICSVSLMAFAFLLAQSRGAWISLAVSLLVLYAALLRKKLVPKYSILGIVPLALVFVWVAHTGNAPVRERIDTIVTGDDGDASLKTRQRIWQGTVMMIKAHPLIGVGAGNFDARFTMFRPKTFGGKAEFSHNDYLQTGAEMGLGAMLLMILMIGHTVAKGLGKSSDISILGYGTGALSLALHGFIDFNFHIPANVILFIIYAGIINASHSIATTAPNER